MATSTYIKRSKDHNLVAVIQELRTMSGHDQNVQGRVD
jgi:hypothetical protein